MLNNGSSTSAGVYGGTEDNSVRGVAVSSSIGAMVFPSHRGAVGVPTLVVDKKGFRKKFGNPDANLTYGHFCAEHFLEEASQLYVTRVAKNPLFGSVRVATVNNFATIDLSVEGFADPEDYSFNEQDILFIYAADPGNWNNDIRVVLYPDVSDSLGEKFVLEVYEGTSTIASEVYRATLRDKLDGYGTQLNIETQLEAKRSIIRVRVNTKHPKYVANDGTRLVNSVITGDLTWGSDGDAITIDNIIDGWDAYADVEEVTVTLLINGGYSSPAVHLKMLDLAETRGDAFAILDMPSDSQTTQAGVAYRRNSLNANSSFGAIYTPDLNILNDDNVNIWCPPSGYVAACYARTDRVAAEWFAPAGITRGKVLANGVREVYRQGDRDTFDQNQINFIHRMPSYGLVLWSQETLQAQASALSNIHVRRLINSLMTQLKNAAMVGVYEPNDKTLRLQLTNVAEGILGPIKRGRGLYGYEIICNDKNNTPELEASGDVILDVYVDPMMIAKRIHLNAIVPRTGQIQYAITTTDRS